MIIVIDNKDSFTYNLIDYFKTETDKEIVVYEVDDVSVDLLRSSNVEAIVISPGPGKPSDYPILTEIMNQFEGEIPILGILWRYDYSWIKAGSRSYHDVNS